MALSIQVFHHCGANRVSITVGTESNLDGWKQYSMDSDGWLFCNSSAMNARATKPRGSKVWHKVVALLATCERWDYREFAQPFIYTVPTESEYDATGMMHFADFVQDEENTDWLACKTDHGFRCFYAGHDMHSHNYVEPFAIAAFLDGFRTARDEYESAIKAVEAVQIVPVVSESDVTEFVWSVNKYLTEQGAEKLRDLDERKLCSIAIRYGVGPYDCAAQVLANRSDGVA